MVCSVLQTWLWAGQALSTAARLQERLEVELVQVKQVIPAIQY